MDNNLPQNNQIPIPQPAKNSSLSMKAVVIIFFSVFFVLIAIIGAIIYFFIGTKLQSINQYSTEITQTKNLWSAGRYQEALAVVNKALSNAKTNEQKAAAHYWIGLINYKQQNTNTAESELKLALELFPNYAAPYVTLSAIEMDRGNFQKALELAQKCAKLDPKYAWCENNIGLSLMYLGRKEEGITYLEKAVSLAPDSYVFRDNLTRAKQTK